MTMITINTIPAKPLVISLQKQIKISGLNFVQVSKSRPESYNVFDCNGNQVGYVCLRWGCLSCADVKGERIYESFFESDYMSEFDSDEMRQIFLEDVAYTLMEKVSGIKHVYQQFECIKWFFKYSFTFAEKGDVCNLIGKLKDDSWIVKAENGAIQIVEDKKFREHFGVRIVLNESNVVICA